MARWKTGIIVAIVWALAGGAGGAEPRAAAVTEARAAAEREKAKQAQRELVAGANAFAVDLYRYLAKTDQDNLLFSPTSIHTALAMTLAGARAQTAAQMRKTLHYTLDDDALHAEMAKLTAQLNNPRVVLDCRPYELTVANALWGQTGFPFDTSYMDLVSKHYGAPLMPVDFAHRPQARKRINDWVSERTARRIPELIGPGVLHPEPVLVLTNAVYLKATWASQFKTEATVDEPFHRLEGKAVAVPTMHRTGKYDYTETDTLQVLRMPYTWNELAMYILLPTDRVGLVELEKTFSAAMLQRVIGAVKPHRVNVSIPKFTLRRSFELVSTLAAMGMPDAFNLVAADFSGMTTSQVTGLFISKVIHEAFISVDEKATEAAVATALGMSIGIERVPARSREFAADHPFLVLIRHEATGAILFIGRVTDPKAKTSDATAARLDAAQ